MPGDVRKTADARRAPLPTLLINRICGSAITAQRSPGRPGVPSSTTKLVFKRARAHARHWMEDQHPAPVCTHHVAEEGMRVQTRPPAGCHGTAGGVPPTAQDGVRQARGWGGCLGSSWRMDGQLQPAAPQSDQLQHRPHCCPTTPPRCTRGVPAQPPSQPHCLFSLGANLRSVTGFYCFSCQA